MTRHSRTTARSLVAPLAIAAALFPGCFGDTRDTLDPYGPGGIDATLAAATCSFLFDCCNGAERAQVGQFLNYSTKDECLEDYSKTIRRGYWVIEDGESAGRLEWNREAAQACVANLEEAAANCDAEKYYAGSDGECTNEDLVDGKVADGDECYDNLECETDGAFCEVDNGDEDETIVTVRGECEPPLEEGDDCIGEDLACAPDLYCNFTDDECQRFVGVGQSCEDGKLCDATVAFCEFDFDDGAVCRGLKDNGEECFLDGECKSGLCTDDECGGMIIDDEIDTTYEICTGDQ